MTTKQIKLEAVYAWMQRIEHEIDELRMLVLHNQNNATAEEGEPLVLADEDLLAECWLSREDEAAFAYLQ